MDADFYSQKLPTLSGTSSDQYVKGLYDEWATNYDKDTSDHGYIAHKSCTQLFDKTLEGLHGESRKKLRILDAGAGTGIVGVHLKELGYSNVDGLDISPQMLNIAKERNVYQELICAPLSAELIPDITKGAYDGTICVGTITVGHVKPPALEEMVRHIKAGGIICFTIRRDAYENEEYGYKAKMEELEKSGTWELVSRELIQYHTHADELLSKCYAIIYKISNRQ